jgi:hypothetical protein
MAFGQPSGPPATARQLKELLELLQAAGHADFRDARGPMGFTQRQAGGKFTRDEADEFIAFLQDSADAKAVGDTSPEQSDPVPAPARPVRRAPVPARRPTKSSPLGAIASEDLAAELQSRGWVVMEP